MSKIDMILSVYGENRKSKTYGDEKFNCWSIKDMSIEELKSTFNKKEIKTIYYSAV